MERRSKTVVYKSGVDKEMSLQEIVDILAFPDQTKISTLPAVKPKGGEVYVYRCPDWDTRHDIRADQYVWCQQGTKKMPKDNPLVKRFYMYIRTAAPIRNIYSKRPKKTFAKYDVRFMKVEFELINTEDPLVLVHYIGDETVWKPFRHGNSVRNDRPFVRTMRTAVKRKVLELGAVAPPKEVYKAMLSGPIGEPGYEAVTAPRNKEQIRNYLKFANINRRKSGQPQPPPPKRRNVFADDQYQSSLDMGDDWDSLSPPASPDLAYDLGADLYADPYDVGLVPADDDNNEGVLNALDPRSKFFSLYSTFEICHGGRLHGFVNSMALVPQCLVVASNRNVLGVVNELVRLDKASKIDRFEFYYVSAGPVAGGYYLTTLLFRHSLFESEPVVPAAYMIHERSNVTDHRRVFELLKSKCTEVNGTDCVFITDREFASISAVLPSAKQLYSWNYFEDDVVNWVENNGGTNDDAHRFWADVYALMKMRNLDRFNRELPARRARWPSTFCNYFDVYLKPDILAKAARWKAIGLGPGIYDSYTGVSIPSCTSLNQLVGDLVEWPEATLEQLVHCLYYFSDYYATEIDRSMRHVGSWKLHTKYNDYGKYAASDRFRVSAPFGLGNTTNIVNHVRMLATTERDHEEVVITETI